MFINQYMIWFPDNGGRVLATGGKRADGLSMGGLSKLRDARAGGIGGLGHCRPPGWAIGGGGLRRFGTAAPRGRPCGNRGSGQERR